MAAFFHLRNDCKMAVADDRSATKRVREILQLLGTPAHCYSFSERGKRQIQELQRFQEAIQLQDNEEGFRLFCKSLIVIDHIRSCIAEKATSVDAKREKSYKLFYEKRISVIPKQWDDFHAALGLQQPDPVWPQTANRLLFNQELLASIQSDGMLECRQVVASGVDEVNLGADEENIIRYMAGYIPFKLLKFYKKKDSAEAADVVDFLSAMSQPGPEEDFYAYTEAWTKAISRGGIFEVSSDVFSFFRHLDILMRKLLPEHLIRGTIDKDEVMEAITKDEDLMFQWAILTCQLLNEGSQSVLKQVLDTWMTIRGHAFARQLIEQYQHDTKKGTRKKLSLRKELYRGHV